MPDDRYVLVPEKALKDARAWVRSRALDADIEAFLSRAVSRGELEATVLTVLKVLTETVVEREAAARAVVRALLGEGEPDA